jgi:hypothetical protein
MSRVRRRPRRALAVLVGAVLAAAPAATAGAPVPDVGVSVEPGTTGFLTVVLRGPLGASVTVSELATGGAPSIPVATVILHQPTVRLRDAVAWRCTDLDPTIEASDVSTYGGVQSARASTSTPSCAHRLSVAVVATRLHAGYPAAIEVSDAWGQGGLRVRGCLGGRCATEILRSRQPALLRLRPRFAGIARLTVSDAYGRSSGA